MNNMKHKILSLLVLLLTAASGAWAAAYTVTDLKVGDIVKIGDVLTIPAGATECRLTYDGKYLWISSNENPSWELARGNAAGTYPDQSVVAADGTNFVFSQTGSVKGVTNNWVDDHYEYGSFPYNDDGLKVSAVDFTDNIAPKITFELAEPDIIVAWDTSTNTGTFLMPGNNVVLTPIYASAATIDEAKKPKAVEDDIFAETTTKLVEGGETSEGTLMYILTSSDQAPTSTEGFSADVPTAENITEPGTYYVWYYIAGDDTHSDSEIMDPIAIKILSNKFTLTLSPAPVENVTVTVDGTAATPDSEGKIAEVKATKQVKLKAKDGYKFKKVVVKKAVAGKTITIPSRIGDPVTLVYADGDTWSTIIEKNSDKIRKAGIDSIDYNGCPLVDLTANKYVKTSEPIDPTHSYKFDNEWSAN